MAKTGTSTNNLFRDASHAPVPVGGSFQTSDATTSPNVSPLTVSSSAIDLIVPSNAIKLVITNASAGVRVSELPAVSNYLLVQASGTLSIDCSRMTDIYLIRDSGDAVVQFYFSLV